MTVILLADAIPTPVRDAEVSLPSDDQKPQYFVRD